MRSTEKTFNNIARHSDDISTTRSRFFLVDRMRGNFLIILNPCVCLPEEFLCCHRTCVFFSQVIGAFFLNLYDTSTHAHFFLNTFLVSVHVQKASHVCNFLFLICTHADFCFSIDSRVDVPLHLRHCLNVPHSSLYVCA